jgi:hypothetical protein
VIDQSVDERVFRCWQRGDTIGTTIHSVKKYCNVVLTFEQVRLMFVGLSEKF